MQVEILQLIAAMYQATGYSAEIIGHGLGLPANKNYRDSLGVLALIGLGASACAAGYDPQEQEPKPTALDTLDPNEYFNRRSSEVGVTAEQLEHTYQSVIGLHAIESGENPQLAQASIDWLMIVGENGKLFGFATYGIGNDTNNMVWIREIDSEVGLQVRAASLWQRDGAIILENDPNTNEQLDNAETVFSWNENTGEVFFHQGFDQILSETVPGQDNIVRLSGVGLGLVRQISFKEEAQNVVATATAMPPVEVEKVVEVEEPEPVQETEVVELKMESGIVYAGDEPVMGLGDTLFAAGLIEKPKLNQDKKMWIYGEAGWKPMLVSKGRSSQGGELMVAFEPEEFTVVDGEVIVLAEGGNGQVGRFDEAAKALAMSPIEAYVEELPDGSKRGWDKAARQWVDGYRLDGATLMRFEQGTFVPVTTVDGAVVQAKELLPFTGEYAGFQAVVGMDGRLVAMLDSQWEPSWAIETGEVSLGIHVLTIENGQIVNTGKNYWEWLFARENHQRVDIQDNNPNFDFSIVINETALDGPHTVTVKYPDRVMEWWRLIFTERMRKDGLSLEDGIYKLGELSAYNALTGKVETFKNMPVNKLTVYFTQQDQQDSGEPKLGISTRYAPLSNDIVNEEFIYKPETGELLCISEMSPSIVNFEFNSDSLTQALRNIGRNLSLTNSEFEGLIIGAMSSRGKVLIDPTRLYDFAARYEQGTLVAGKVNGDWDRSIRVEKSDQ